MSNDEIKFLDKPSLLGQGVYLQLVVNIKLLDETIIRSNDPEEVLTFKYNELGERFIIPWRKIKGKLRRYAMEKQRGLSIGSDCFLKDDLCMKCPACFLFGGTGETSKAKVPYNILGRVLGETFISKNKVEKINPYTANAVGEKDLSTGQALMTIITVPKETEFIGVITIKDPTKEMAEIIIDNIDRMTRIGARSVEWGRTQCNIIGYQLSDREKLSAYDIVDKLPVTIEKDFSKLSLPEVNEAYKNLNDEVTNLIESELSKK